MMDAGHCSIYQIINVQDPGDMPKEELQYHTEADFENRNIGITRQYAAKGVDERVDMVIRIWDEGPVLIDMIALLTDYDWQMDPDGDQYRITNVQPTVNSDGLKVIDLTLQRLGEAYDIERETGASEEGTGEGGRQ